MELLKLLIILFLGASHLLLIPELYLSANRNEQNCLSLQSPRITLITLRHSQGVLGITEKEPTQTLLGLTAARRRTAVRSDMTI